MMKKYRTAVKVSLVLVYLVICAGAVVRMTGSGMGCPDWPKCFGYYIPPTDRADLEWTPGRAYEKGQVIIRGEGLLVAREDFQSEDTFQETQWEPYTRHDYAEFNAFHTWTEFINRLLGALAGLATLVMAVFALSYWKKDSLLTLLSWAVVFGMGFQAWLGATVVYSVLAPARITMHMVMALVIVALLIYLLYRSSSQAKSGLAVDKGTRNFLWLALGLTVVQVVLGTQVRQFVDDQADRFINTPELWLQDPTLIFYVHRSFSILVTLLNVYLAYRIFTRRLPLGRIRLVLALIGLEILTGIAMYYLDFPFGSQPLHLVLAALLFGLQFYLVMEARNSGKTLKTS